MENIVLPEGSFRTEAERKVGEDLARIFSECPDTLEAKLENFPKYIRRQKLTRMLALYEIFKKILSIKGSIIECGVYRGFGLMAWANFSAVLEPNNLTRRIYGFDTFEGFVGAGPLDKTRFYEAKPGDLKASSYDELLQLIRVYDSNRFLGHIPKVILIKGDVIETIPKFIEENPHVIVSLLFLDLDLYEPTKVAVERLLPRMPKGAIIAFDELDNPIWPGETMALLETIGIKELKIERLDFDPYIGYALIS
jgi:hypothetical protein